MTRQNFGGQRQQPLVGPGGIPLMSDEQKQAIMQQQMIAEENRRTRADIDQTAQFIYVGLVVKDINLTLSHLQELDPERFRHLAAVAMQTAPFLAERQGRATLSIPGMEVVTTSDSPPTEDETNVDTDTTDELGNVDSGV